MRVGTVQNPYHHGINAAHRAQPMERWAFLDQAGGNARLEAAQKALLEAKERLDQQRDADIEAALPGYKALCARQRSYEEQLRTQQAYLEDFQTLSSRQDALSAELAKAQGMAGTLEESGRMSSQSRQLAALEQELATVDQDITALVEGMNRYTSSQKQYAAYLEKTGQSGYAAALYQDQPAYTRENVVSETTGMIQRLETGTQQWRERVSAYCEDCGFRAYDFERYIQERHALGDAYATAKQRLAELLYTQDGPDQAEEGEEAPLVSGRVDTVEISGDVCDQRI